ncbi:amino acid adenylation domain-containing protein/thioester reductase-like protein [Chitinophaga niastensis]|uniref:Amino acid adenylation domain-containing protein/thioester reductase-like protein n=1 Tax=Chitinophaga niastensis TaxID=536980 RepID=A0A2P8HDQ6_CHINA|nr:non-ribosomal peptide synthetase [Chitinophaga niastensis]PSL44366.1 amino acid adenylation domain-containing protein/thioester reductase-like protein [Chitinophaga niastensis]
MSTWKTSFSGSGDTAPGIIMTAEEKNTILYEFNDTFWNYAPQETLVSLFEKQVSNTPEHTAVVFRGLHMTYKELDEKSNQVAHYLLSRDVKPGMFVPIWLDRSLEWLAAVIGILKTGAAYIPIDPVYPLKRAVHIIADAHARIVITSAASAILLRDTANAAIFCLDSLAAVSSQPVTSTGIRLQEQSLAYIIYTSGSTGNPKGVMITHQSIQHLVTWHNQRFNVNETCRLALVAGLSFDLSVWEIWSALLSGATLYVADNEERTDAVSLLAYFRSNYITHGFAPTVLVPAIVKHSKEETGLRLKYLFTGGEQLKPVYTNGLPYQLIDYYGPTECTVFATYREVKEKDGQFIASIGTPVANTQVYILNQQQEVLPIGATGELCISGAGLAAGYLNNEALTKNKFITHPFLQGQKLYLTGDQARWLPDGNIQFLGRTDNQVKIRGCRVELGEIERALLRLPNISNAAVIVRENAGNNKYLIAFIVFENLQEEPDITFIKQQLKLELPGYMIPARFAVIQEIALTENSKINSTQLADIAAQYSAEAFAAEPPTNETERVIAAVWSQVLEYPVRNISDNFFDIGGDSLLVATVVAAINSRLSVKVYIRDLYQYPVLQELAAVLIKRGEQVLSSEDVEPYVELQQDVYLAPGTIITKEFDEHHLSHPSAILLTGATGFVGIHLLQELLDKTTADIYCLVRAQDEHHVMEKINSCFTEFKITITAEHRQRIIPVVGDFSKTCLGLTEAQFSFLAEMIDVIYHSGSSVNFIEPYSYMKSPNVNGLREIIRLATARKTKCLVLLSTISVYSWGHVFTGKTLMKETDDIAQNLLAVSKDIGYVRSKWVMEAIADLAAAQGLPVITCRLGLAMCHSVSGASAPYQWWARLVKNCIELGSYPLLTQLREGLITVDYMTKAIAHISKNKAAIGMKFNLIASPQTNLTLEDFFCLLQQYYPFKLKGLPYKEWRKQWEDDSSNRLFPLTSLFRDNMHEGLSTMELYQHTYIWDCQNVIDFLKDTDIKEPVFNKRLLGNYLKYLDIPVAR